jgi:hypothetical protein
MKTTQRWKAAFRDEKLIVMPIDFYVQETRLKSVNSFDSDSYELTGYKTFFNLDWGYASKFEALNALQSQIKSSALALKNKLDEHGRNIATLIETIETVVKEEK